MRRQFVFVPASNSRGRLVFRGISVFLWNRINRAKRQHRSCCISRLKNLNSRDADSGDHFVALGGQVKMPGGQVDRFQQVTEISPGTLDHFSQEYPGLVAPGLPSPSEQAASAYQP